jgi:hypothetical protein
MSAWAWFRLGLLIAVAAATALLALIGVQAIQEPAWVLYLLASFVGAATIGDQGGRLLSDQLKRPTEDQSREIRRYLSAALLTISHQTQLAIPEVGLSLWLVPRWWQLVPHWLIDLLRRTSRDRERPTRHPRLWRAEKIRLAEFGGASRVHWTFRKGVIGECWMAHHVIGFDCWKNYRPYLDFDDEGNPSGPGVDERTWNDPSNGARMGLSYREFGEVAGKYGAVIATPLHSRTHRWVGCVTLDVPWDDLYRSVWRAPVRRALADAARDIERTLKVSST